MSKKGHEKNMISKILVDARMNARLMQVELKKFIGADKGIARGVWFLPPQCFIKSPQK